MIRFYIMLKRISAFKNMCVPITDGFLKNYLWSLATSDETYLSGNFDKDTLVEFEKYIRPNQVVYDLGANEGYYAISASKIVESNGKVFAFEPMPENLRLLNKHISVNKIKNITVIDKAVSNKNDILTFSKTDDRAGNTYVNSSPKFEETTSRFEVFSVALDHFCITDKNPSPDVLKIDVEGAEYDVLIGAQQVIEKYKPIVILATHDYHVVGIKDACLDFFTKRGYDYYKLGNHNSEKFADFVFYPKK